MQVDIKRLDPCVPMSFMSEAECDRKARIDADDRVPPMFISPADDPFDVEAQIKRIGELMIIQEPECPISNSGTPMMVSPIFEITDSCKRSEVVPSIPEVIVP